MRTIIQSMLFLSLISLSSFASAQQMDLKLAPNASKVITNSYVWTISAKCTIATKGKSNTLVVRIKEHGGDVNGKNLVSGQTLSVVVHNNDSLSVSADPSTTLTLQNKGIESVQATCST